MFKFISVLSNTVLIVRRLVMVKQMEPTTGIEPVNLFLTKEALYRLSYVGT